MENLEEQKKFVESQTCCCSEEDAPTEDSHDHHHHGGETSFKAYIPSIISFGLLVIGLLFEYVFHLEFFNGWVKLAWYLCAYIPVGYPVVKKGIELALKGKVFTEFFLMSIATIGAFLIHEYPEGVAVMLFYSIGELFQDAAVNRAKRSIKALLDIRPQVAEVYRQGKYLTVPPKTVNIGETIRIKSGEKVPLDGVVLSESSSFNTSAITGESKPDSIHQGEMALAGMINTGVVVQLKVTRRYEDSALARIFFLVQEATQKKAKTEQFIRKFARIYTPIVVYMAIALLVLPYFFVEHYMFSDWLYRALVFLVISCPCAFVISVPLGYFGGIGAASRHGILFKGSNYLDAITKVNTVVMDKTGTLTKGVFKVKTVISNLMKENEFLQILAALESNSTHPIAKAISESIGDTGHEYKVEQVEEISGYGIIGIVDGQHILAGNKRLMERYEIPLDLDLSSIVNTVVFVAVDNKFAGYCTLADELKPDAQDTVRGLHEIGIRDIQMLSGDKELIVQQVANELNIDSAFGDLLPEQKLEKVSALKLDSSRTVAFVGDGINDAPVLALADVGIAMGGLGSDAAIETADVVIQTDQPSKIITAIKIGKATKRIVWQNISLAFGVKVIVLVMGAIGLATMWAAVFADVGVALLAILNAVRMQRYKA